MVFGLCAGYQILGGSWRRGGPAASGLGLLDIRSGRGEKRAVGDLGDMAAELTSRHHRIREPPGVTQLGPNAKPFAEGAHGIGNGDGYEGG